MHMARSIRRKALLVGTVAAALLASACAGDGAGRVEFLSLGTAGTGGIYYPIGGALASRLSARDPLRQYTAEVTGGSVENINRLKNGQMDLAFALPVTIWEAYHGGETFPEAFEDLRILAPLYPNLSHLMVTPRSGIERLADLRGKRVAVGPPGSGTEQMARQILASAGITYDDVDERFLSFAELAMALKDRAIDAALISVGYPASSVLDATTTGGIRLVALDSASVHSLRVEHPYYAMGEIPAGAYPGVDRPLPTLSLMNWVVARADLDDEVVFHLLDIFRDELNELERVHPMAGQIDLSGLDDAPIPLHPAVERWRARQR